jgi:hypothetical protein
MRGKSVSVENIKKFIDNSYKDNPDNNIEDFELDRDLSNQYGKVYFSKSKNQAIITHRGTSGLNDWKNNFAYGLGQYEKTDRFKTGKKLQEEAERKYGKKNISVIGHSQGAILSHKLGRDDKEIINLNPASLGEPKWDNEFDIKSGSDIVSLFSRPTLRTINIKSANMFNVLNEHSTNILDRLNPKQMVGLGFKKIRGRFIKI